MDWAEGLRSEASSSRSRRTWRVGRKKREVILHRVAKLVANYRFATIIDDQVEYKGSFTNEGEKRTTKKGSRKARLARRISNRSAIIRITSYLHKLWIK